MDSPKIVPAENEITLVCDAGMGNWSVFFKPLAAQLSGLMPVYLVDRPGYTSNEIPSAKRLCETAASELHEMLNRNGITGNLVLVGHSLGGLNMRMYCNKHPEKVKGLILLDAANPGLLEVIPEIKVNIQLQIRQVNKLIKMAKWGLLKFAKKRIPTFGLPAELYDEYYRVVIRSRYYQLYKKEMEVFEENLQQCKQLGSLGNLPLLVICSNKGLNTPIGSKQNDSNALDLRWINLQKDNALLSANSSFHEINGDHFFYVTEAKQTAALIKMFLQKSGLKK